MPVDSHVTVATQRPDTECCSIQHVYRIKDGLPLMSTAPHDWRPGETLPPTGRRDNYRGTNISGATVVSDERRFVIDIINTACKERLTLLSAFDAGDRRRVGQLSGHQISTLELLQQVPLCADDEHSHSTELRVRRPAFCHRHRTARHHTSPRVPYKLTLLTRGPYLFIVPLTTAMLYSSHCTLPLNTRPSTHQKPSSAGISHDCCLSQGLGKVEIRQ